MAVRSITPKTTKPDKPTYEVKYSTSKDQWYARFNCKTKGATIKYKSYGKYKSINLHKYYLSFWMGLERYKPQYYQKNDLLTFTQYIFLIIHPNMYQHSFL